MTGAVSSRVRTAALNRGFAPVMVFSVLLHGGALGGVVYAQYHHGPRGPVINSIPVELVKLGKPRDPNLLPRITQPAVAPPPPDDGVALDVANKDKTPTKPKDRPKPKDPQLSDAAKRLLDSARDADLDRAINKIDEDEGAENGSIYGTTTDATNAASGYLAQVSEVLHKNYKLPATISESERRFLSADVVLYIERDGTISNYEFVQAPTNEAFKRALDLLLKTVKLPPPPGWLANEYAKTGLGVRFKPDG